MLKMQVDVLLFGRHESFMLLLTEGTFEYTLESEFKWRSKNFLVVSHRLSSEEFA